MIGQALLNLADIAACVGGDFHTMHLNFEGSEFDSMHKEVLKDYYEQADEDYDSWAEAALMFDDVPTAPNKNESASRIEWLSFDDKPVNKEIAVSRTNEILEAYMTACVIVFNKLSENTSCFKSIGIANTIQTRVEYWSKELAYFNKHRGGKTL